MSSRRRSPRIGFALAAAAAFAAATPAAAQDPSASYPAKPIRWIVPYPTGGTSDFLARLIGQKLTDAWKQPVVIDNRAGAGGNIGTEAVAKAPPDGYTMLFVASTMTMNQSVYPNLSFDAERDFAPVTTVLWQPFVLVVHPSLPVKSVKEFIALARARPGELNYSSGGNGNAGHIAAALFGTMTKTKVTHVAYRGQGPAIVALLAGEVHFTFASLVTAQPYQKSGRMRVIGVTGRERIAALPDVPTVSEAGVPGFIEGNWQGVLLPAQTPRAVVMKINQEIVRILKTTDVSGQIQRIGADVIANSPEQFAAMIRADVKKHADLAKAIGLRLE